MFKRRQIVLPMPVDDILLHKNMATAPVAVVGAVWHLLALWWQSGCKPLPDDDATLAALARCNTGQWYRVRAVVRETLAELTPKLLEMRQVMEERVASAHRNGQRAAMASAQARRERAMGLRAPKEKAPSSGAPEAPGLHPTASRETAAPAAPHMLQRSKKPPSLRGEGGLLGDKKRT